MLAFDALDDRSVDVRVDGVLDEAIWSRVEPVGADYKVINPDTLADVPYDTTLRIFTTEKGIYVGAYLQQPADTRVRRLTSRDRRINRDSLGITFDTSGQGRYGYWFTVSLGDSLSDGTVLPERQFSNEWNGPWQGRTSEDDDGWYVEMFLPWNMLSMPAQTGERRISMYSSRQVAHRNERWGWPALPDTQPLFMSVLQPVDTQAVQTGQQFTFYPYASGNYDGYDGETRWKGGAELFWRPRQNVQVSATVAPDFGSVETDDVVVNLSAFEVFFRERRPFFLEDQDVFETTPRADSGNGRVRTTLLNTRRIGARPIEPELDDDQAIDDVALSRGADLLGAAKLTGNSGRLRYGLLAAFEDDTDFLVTDERDGSSFGLTQQGRDFGALRLLYEDASGGGYRQFGWLSTRVQHPELEASVQAVDGHWLSGTGALKLDGQLVYSDVREDGDRTEGFGAVLDARYTPRKGVRHELLLNAYDDQLDYNDFGFLRRNDAFGGQYNLELTRTDLEHVRRRFSALRLIQEYNDSGQLVSAGVFANREWQFHTYDEFELNLGWRPARWDDRNSRGNGAFRVPHRPRLGFEYRSDPSQVLAWQVFTDYNQEDLGGHKIEFGGELNLRPPSGTVSLNLQLRRRLSDDWLVYQEDRDFTAFDAEFWQPRVSADLFLSARQQLRLSLQWTGIQAREQEFWRVPEEDGDLIPREPGDETDSFNRSDFAMQLRYRWEFAPLSDLALVYTRAGSLDTAYDPTDGYGTLFNDSFDDPEEDLLVLRLRYRLGT